MPITVEGWFPNPDNATEELRWDGHRWTGEARSVAQDAMPTRSPRRKRNLVAAGGAALVAAVALTAVVVAPAIAGNAQHAEAITACQAINLGQSVTPSADAFAPMDAQDVDKRMIDLLLGPGPTQHSTFVFVSAKDSRASKSCLIGFTDGELDMSLSFGSANLSFGR